MLIRALVDPSLLIPPAEGAPLAWLRLLRGWSKATREFDQDVIGIVMSRDSQAGLAAATGGLLGLREVLDRCGSPLGAPDVLKLIEGIRARTSLTEDVFEPSEVIFSSLALKPGYIGAETPDLCDQVETDVGHAAVFTQETNVRVALITPPKAWAEASASVAVKAQVEAWEKYGITEEPSTNAATVSEEIPFWQTPQSADSTLSEDWAALIDHPLLGIEVAYREFTSGDEEAVTPLEVKVGSQLCASMKAMGYNGKAGRVKAVFRAAAYIGSKRAGDLRSLQAHPYRQSSGPTSPPVERDDGAKLMRGSLGKGRNAHRLMWWEAATPEILGVVEHEQNPLYLT